MKGNISRYVLYGLIGLAIIIFIAGILGSYNLMLYYSYALLAVTIILALAASVMGFLTDRSKLKPALIGIVGILVIVGISYALASDEVLDAYGPGITESTSRWSGAGLYIFYILFFMAFGSIIYSAVSKMMK